MAELAKELVDLKVDLIVTSGPGVFAVRGVTNTLPIVVTAAPDPVAFGLAESLATPAATSPAGLRLEVSCEARRFLEAGEARDDARRRALP